MELPRYNKSCFKYLYLSYNLVNHSVVIAVIYLRGKKSSFDCRFCRGNEIAAGERAHRAEDTNYPIWKSSSQTPHLTLSLVWEHQKKEEGEFHTISQAHEEMKKVFSAFHLISAFLCSLLLLLLLLVEAFWNWKSWMSRRFFIDVNFAFFFSSNSSKESFFE